MHGRTGNADEGPAGARTERGDWSRPGILFVVGTGRSGTHLVGHILRAFPDVRITIEETPAFGWATALALDPRREPELLPKLLERYRSERVRSAPCLYADKSHPALWLAEHLLDAFPDAGFLGVQRGPLATVASMLRHEGVLEWHSRWRDFPVPNRFLGIDAAVAERYETLPLAARCALRWRAHAERMEELAERLGPRLHPVRYEDLVQRPEREVRRLSRFLGLSSPPSLPAIHEDSLERWRTQLSPEEVVQVAREAGSMAADEGREA